MTYIQTTSKLLTFSVPVNCLVKKNQTCRSIFIYGKIKGIKGYRCNLRSLVTWTELKYQIPNRGLNTKAELVKVTWYKRIKVLLSDDSTHLGFYLKALPEVVHQQSSRPAELSWHRRSGIPFPWLTRMRIAHHQYPPPLCLGSQQPRISSNGTLGCYSSHTLPLSGMCSVKNKKRKSRVTIIGNNFITPFIKFLDLNSLIDKFSGISVEQT